MSPFTVLGLSGGRDQTQRNGPFLWAIAELCQVSSVRHLPVLPVFDLSPVSSPVCPWFLRATNTKLLAFRCLHLKVQVVPQSYFQLPLTRQVSGSLHQYYLLISFRAQRPAVGTFVARPAEECVHVWKINADLNLLSPRVPLGVLYVSQVWEESSNGDHSR